MSFYRKTQVSAPRLKTDTSSTNFARRLGQFAQQAQDNAYQKRKLDEEKRQFDTQQNMRNEQLKQNQDQFEANINLDKKQMQQDQDRYNAKINASADMLRQSNPEIAQQATQSYIQQQGGAPTVENRDRLNRRLGSMAMMQTEKTPPKLQTVETKDGVMLYDPTTGSVVKNMGQPNSGMNAYQQGMMQLRIQQEQRDKAKAQRDQRMNQIKLGDMWRETSQKIGNYDELNPQQQEYMKKQFFDTGVAPQIKEIDDGWFSSKYVPEGYEQYTTQNDPEVQKQLNQFEQIMSQLSKSDDNHTTRE
jgi:hypothetical protein